MKLIFDTFIDFTVKQLRVAYFNIQRDSNIYTLLSFLFLIN
nr:MAG TPA: hypothetical protein [Caudoviricetes sp.]